MTNGSEVRPRQKSALTLTRGRRHACLLLLYPLLSLRPPLEEAAQRNGSLPLEDDPLNDPQRVGVGDPCRSSL